MNELEAKNRRVARRATLFVAVMLGLAFASVPLYRAFCQATGYGGTPRRAEVAPGAVAGEHLLTVRFDANTDKRLPWRFEPEQTSVTVRPGERKTIFYDAENLSDKPLTGQAAYNVSPDQSGAYFNKIQCFCFNEQTLAPREKKRMPVIFFVDPGIEKPDGAPEVKEITLSYTFYPVASAAKAS
ncbi:cytochrome c oxidase assembly protein [Sphingomonas sp. ASV193]|uniref:cytochrome c oxidase assembly protein n=1 Tax=Sphingomonas sp. ASV193 TaxID=3144405 RepID=UPI0032E884F7